MNRDEIKVVTLFVSLLMSIKPMIPLT